jgi:CspA family cold shock protein
MSIGKVKLYNADRGFGFIKPDDGTGDVFFHVTALREDDAIEVGAAVKYEIGHDAKTGKSKALSVDLV